MHALAGFMPKTNCTIDGSKINTASLIESIYLITQNHYIDQSKWMELFSIKDTELQELLNLLELNEITQFENIGYNGQNLSSGQRNRVALALSIFSKKSLIIFDETLSGIHTSVREKFLKYLDDVQDKNFIIVTHEQDIINNIQNNVLHKKI
jgi:energy-coupling factor transport system ATP-binding protein